MYPLHLHHAEIKIPVALPGSNMDVDINALEEDKSAGGVEIKAHAVQREKVGVREHVTGGPGEVRHRHLNHQHQRVREKPYMN